MNHLLINKIDKIKKKMNKGKGNIRIRKTQSERKGESEMGPKPGLPKNNSNEEAKSGRVDC